MEKLSQKTSEAIYLEYQQKILRFLSDADQETVIACLVGLAALTYFILGRIGLILIGFIGGVVLHASWTPKSSDASSPGQRQAVDIALAWQSRNSLPEHEPPTSDHQISPHTQQALTRFADNVVADYVKWWYHPLIPAEQTFPSACRDVLTNFLLSMAQHISRKRAADTVLEIITNSSSIIIVFLSELSKALNISRGGDVEALVNDFLAANPDGSLANVIDAEQQLRKTRQISEDVLTSFVDPQTLACLPVRRFLKEVLVSLILSPTVTSFSRADTINSWIIALLEDSTENAKIDLSKEQKSVSRAEDAMAEAMMEAKRLSELIAADDAAKATTPILEHPPASDYCEDASPSERILDKASVTIQDSSRPEVESIAPLSLHQAKLSIMDDSGPGEKATLKSRPLTDYLLQIEPQNSHYSGWMIVRKYGDFESLHEVLRRISVISGVAEFAQKYPSLPAYKGQTKAKLSAALAAYLQDALVSERLAESEGMKRFLEKEQHLDVKPEKSSKGAFPSAFENVGKNMFGALTNAPKGAAAGGKAFVDGVSGVFTSSKTAKRPEASASSPRPSRDSLVLPTDKSSPPSPAYNTVAQADPDVLHLPPRPDDIADDYGAKPTISARAEAAADIEPDKDSDAMSNQSIERKSSTDGNPAQTHQANDSGLPTTRDMGSSSALTMQETTMAVELMFAVITELYTLSSAWTFRLALLNTAKSFLLRPGNANLDAIRQMIQTTAIDANTSDESIAAHIDSIRAAAMPTTAEAQTVDLSPEQRAAQRQRARHLLMTKGMPPALTSVMGQAASSEALGKVFDCLQVERVAQGLVFALLLQVLRAAVQ